VDEQLNDKGVDTGDHRRLVGGKTPEKIPPKMITGSIRDQNPSLNTATVSERGNRHADNLFSLAKEKVRIQARQKHDQHTGQKIR
jgi:hypothetical protein